MDSQKIQEIIISTIEDIAKNTILNTNYLTLISGQISNVDKFNNFYNFTYQKEEYTGFSITGEKYEVGDLVYVLKLNNDLTSKQMIISKVNSYTNFDIEMAINESLEEIKENINQIEAQGKEISIIGNTVFTLNDDLTITPNELTFSAQKSNSITDIVWYVDGEKYAQDDFKKITIPNSLVENKDNVIIRVEDLNNTEVYDEITVIRAMSSDTKLELDLGLDSILLQKDEQGIVDYSKAILTPKVLSDGEDITPKGWGFDYRVEIGEITLVKEQGNYKITNMNSNKGKISFFAIKNGKMYLQRVIYLSIVTYGENNINITASNQNFIISKTNKDKVKEIVLSTTLRATKGTKILKIEPELTVPSIGSAPGGFVTNDDNSVTYSWKLNEDTELASVNGEVELLYTIENEQYNTTILWTTVNDGASGAENRIDISPPNIVKNGDGTFSPNEIVIKSLLIKNGEDIPYNGYFKIYETIDNKNYALMYESEEEENVKTYTISNLDIKSLKIEFLNIDRVLLITEYCYVNVNSSDFVEVTKKTEKNETHLTKVDGQIQGLVKKDETIETTITNLETGTEQKFTEVNNKYSEVNQKVDSVTTTVSSHTKKLENIDGEIANQEERITNAEQKLTAEQWSLWFTEVVNNKTATSTKFTMDKNGLHVKGGGIDILNNTGSKVFYADNNGNLVINNLTANNGTFNGTINATKGTIKGLTIEGNTIKGGTIDGTSVTGALIKGTTIDGSSFITTKQRTLDVRSGDDTKIQNILLGRYTPTSEEKTRLDFNQNGKIDAIDYLIAGRVLAGNLSRTWVDEIKINTDGGTPKITVSTKPTSGDFQSLEVKIGVSSITGSGAYFNKMAADFLENVNTITFSSAAKKDASLSTTTHNDEEGLWMRYGESGIMIKNKKIQVNGDIIFNYSNTKIYEQVYNGSSNLYLYAAGYNAIYSFSNAVYYNGQYVDSNWTTGKFYPGRTGTALGSSANSNRWYRLYAANSSSTSSDKRLKKDISYFDEAPVVYSDKNMFEEFFENLRGTTFVAKDDAFNRIKFGFIAQDVIEALSKVGLTAYDVDFVSHGRDENDQISEDAMYGLCYEEFIPLNTYMIQKNIKEIKTLKEENNKLKQDILDLQTKIDSIIGNTVEVKI